MDNIFIGVLYYYVNIRLATLSIGFHHYVVHFIDKANERFTKNTKKDGFEDVYIRYCHNTTKNHWHYLDDNVSWKAPVGNVGCLVYVYEASTFLSSILADFRHVIWMTKTYLYLLNIRDIVKKVRLIFINYVDTVDT